MYEFYKIVLFEHDLYLQYNRKGKFYWVKKMEKELEATPPALIHESLKLHYYTYKIKNITNQDVVDAMTIFQNVKYKYLKQSDVIAYSATRSTHEQIVKILRRSDNKVKHSTVKITLFAMNDKNIKSWGSDIHQLNFSADISNVTTKANNMIDSVLDSLTSKKTSSFKLNTNSLFSFTLHALKGHSLVDILQEPTIRLTNGVESVVTSVMNVPYLKTTAKTDSTTNSVTESYDYKDIGLQIRINPKIKDDWVYLELDLISEELLSLDDDKPITQKITYRNTIKVEKYKPILLTGIKKVSKRFEKNGIPILSDIPILGQLFKEHSNATEEQNINILIELL